MAIPAQRDLEQARGAIQQWLSDVRPGISDVEVSDLSVPEGTGFSNETLMFTARWTERGATQEHPLVLRVKPDRFRVFLEDDFELQHKVLLELQRHGVRVPPVHELELDPEILGAPFFLMSRVAGRAPSDTPGYNAEGWLCEMAPRERHALWRSAMDAFCELHRAGMHGDFRFLAKPERGPTGLEQQLRYYQESLEWAAQGRPQPVAEAAWTWLSSHVPEHRPTLLSWGDARIANMLFEGTECRALLDWEMVSLGGPEMDLGWWLFLDRFSSDGMGLQRLDGLGTRQETVDLWQEQTGLVAADLEFYEIFAGLRFAVVMMRLAQMFQEWEVPVDPHMETDNPVTRLLAMLLGISQPDQAAR